jgi:hypothetical protein
MKKGILLLALMLISLAGYSQIQLSKKLYLGRESSGKWYKLAEIDAKGPSYNSVVLDVDVLYVHPGARYKIEGLIRIRKANEHLFTDWQYTTQGSSGELIKLVNKGDQVLELYVYSTSNWGHVATNIYGVIEASLNISLMETSVEVSNPGAYPEVATRQDWYYPNGAFMIGTNQSETGYKLAVKGKIKAQEVKVTATEWADFVFADDYMLPPLAEVEVFIQANKHLPAIPSEAEVLEKGIELGEMNAKLLQKIEELTLYTIEQEKRMEQKDRDIQALKARQNRLEALLQQLLSNK